MHVCMSKIGVHCRNFLAKSGLYYDPPREHPMMTRLQSHVLNIPWIMDAVFLCSPVPNKQLTNKWGGPPDWVVPQEGGSESPQADIKISTRLPFRRGVCTGIHHALGMGSLANARTALASEIRAARLVCP
jgi:hypothetical protein